MDRLLFLKRSVWPLVALLLIAFGVRVYQLDAQSLWSDEGLSLYRARPPLSEALSNVIVVPPGVPTRDTNPPLYFVEMGALRVAAGESEYALRFVSVLAGVLLVALLYATGKRLYSAQVGLVAALLGTCRHFWCGIHRKRGPTRKLRPSAWPQSICCYARLIFRAAPILADPVRPGGIGRSGLRGGQLLWPCLPHISIPSLSCHLRDSW
jgi:hypothetical protein